MRKLLLFLMVVGLASNALRAQASDQKEEILNARRAAKDAKKNREYCAKLGFPASAGNNRCFSFYPSKITTWGKGFSDGLAKVTVRGKAGFINTEGKLVIPTKFNDAGHFSEGVAPFEDSKSKWGFIDNDGRVAIPAKFDWAISFSEGLALVELDGIWGYIDHKGKYVIPPKFEEAESFSEGFAAIGYFDKELEWLAATPRKGKWVRRFINNKGQRAVPGDFDGISRGFNGGMAIVSRSLGYSEKYRGMLSESYIVDRSGRELWKLESASIDWFSDDAIIVELERKPNGRSLYNFRDRAGKLLCDTSFENPSVFSEGLAAVRLDNKYGFINKRCEFVIGPQFADANSFSEGLAAVVGESSLTGFIDKSGKWIIEPKFQWVGSFNNGFALILDGSKSGYVDRSGKVIWQPSE